MALPDRVKETTTTVGTGNITLLGAVTQFQPLSAAFTALQSGITLCIADQSGTNWEVSSCTYINATTISRDIVLSSSNAGSLVSFGAGVKDVFYTLSAADIAKFVTSKSATFATAIDLTTGSNRYMPQQSIVSVLAFTVAAGTKVTNSMAYVRLVANGTNIPTFTGFNEWGGSLGWDNRSGIVNQVQFFYDGYDSWYSISQAIGAVSTATAVTMLGPTTGITSTASTNFTIAANGAISGTVIVTPSDAANGGTFTPATVSISSASPSLTFTYTPSSTGAKTISVTNNGGLTNPSNITYTSTASATVPASPTIGTATAGNAAATIAFTAGSNGGSAITGYTATSSPGGFTGTLAGATPSPITVTGLTNSTAYTFAVTATNAVGTSAASAASNSVTPVAAAFARFTNLTRTAESGTGPYVYTGSGGQYGSSTEGDAVSTVAFQSGIDGSLYIKATSTPVTATSEVLLAVATVNTTGNAYPAMNYAIVNRTTGYLPFTSGSAGSAAATVGAINDLIKMTRTGSTLVAAVSKDSGATWTTVSTWAGVSTGVLYVHVLLAGTATFTNTTVSGLA